MYRWSHFGLILALAIAVSGSASGANFFVGSPGDWDDNNEETTPWRAAGGVVTTATPQAGDWVLFHGNNNFPNDQCLTFTGSTGACGVLRIGTEYGEFDGGTPTAFFHQMSGTITLDWRLELGYNGGGVGGATGRGLYVLDAGAALAANEAAKIGSNAGEGNPVVCTFVVGGSVSGGQLLLGNDNNYDTSSTLVLDGSAYSFSLDNQFIMWSENAHLVVRPDASGAIGTIDATTLYLEAGDISMDLCQGYDAQVGDTWTLMTGDEVTAENVDIVAEQAANYQVNYVDNGDGTFSVEVECIADPPAADACTDYAAAIDCAGELPVSGQITPSTDMPIEAGDSLTLTAPDGSGYQWYKDDVLINGATNQTLAFMSLTQDDSGTYTVEYDDGTKVVVISEPYELEVLPEGSLPAIGLAGLLALAALAGGAAAARLRRK